MTAETWTVTYKGELPWSMNTERNWSVWQQRHRKVTEWREMFAWLALEAKLPRGLDRVAIAVRPHRKRKPGRLPDVAACYPAAKAALDGLVDYGLVADDDPSHVIAMTFLPPDIGRFDGLTLRIIDRGPGPAGVQESIEAAS
ncbi:MAG: hypothetical protein GY795_24625 [Desulfobacterales bacterium]|nr:hypothetical protein [Desulfobacterales bacterium]